MRIKTALVLCAGFGNRLNPIDYFYLQTGNIGTVNNPSLLPEKTIDYEKMLRIVKNFGYNGFIGVEYEGSRLSEIDGIKATRDLLIKIGQSI